jgi:DNA polymerase I-like protein with 3'-5' exonuclease and polymerase domains
MIDIHPLRQEGYQLLHEGIQELSRIEGNGIRIDMELLRHTKIDLTEKIRGQRASLESTSEWKHWRKRWGGKSSLTSDAQLCYLLYEALKFPITDYTNSGAPSVDAQALEKIDHPFVKEIRTFRQHEKALGTFLKGIEEETVDGFLHPVFNLHTARTYRSSSDSPNFQNFPVRDDEIAKIIRSLFIARDGGVLCENDFKGIEVSVAACYHHDPNFISYITTPGKDMHRDMAAQIYMLEPEQVSKDARYGAKNKFVFPQFYGDFYINCAKALWEWIDRGKLKVKDTDISLKQHLKEQGITRLGKCNPEEDAEPGTFEYHIQQIERDFWDNRFKDYGQWRKDWYAEYLRKGYFDLYTGFRIFGSYNRNSVTNYPIQGSAFHCLLWSLIQINRRLRKYKFKSKLVGQIHDSMISDDQVNELRDVMEIVEQVTTVELRQHYTWLEVPLEVEYEICPIDKPWFQKKEVKFKQGRFKHPIHDVWTDDAAKFLAALRKLEDK